MSGWYRRFGANFIAGTLDLTFEEKGAYSLCLDLIYDRGAPIPDDPRWIAGVCGISMRRWNGLRDALIAKGKLYLIDGKLSNVKRNGRTIALPARVRAPIPRMLRHAVFRRDGRRCRYCGATSGPFELDHIVPYSRGGGHSVENIVVACKPCNRDKGAMTPEEWLR